MAAQAACSPCSSRRAFFVFRCTFFHAVAVYIYTGGTGALHINIYNPAMARCKEALKRCVCISNHVHVTQTQLQKLKTWKNQENSKEILIFNYFMR